MVALAKLAARYGVACGGTDAAATLEALCARIDAARAEGDAGLAEVLKRRVTEIMGEAGAASSTGYSATD